MSRWPAAIVFDFDGVIVNSEPLHFEALRAVLHDEGIELTEREYYEELIGFDDRGAVLHLYEKRNLPLEQKVKLRILGRKSRTLRALMQSRPIHALPGVEELVRGLWRNYPLAICSGALREEIDVMLEAISLRDCFRLIVAAEDVSQGKPDPEGYLLAIKQLGKAMHRNIEPKECLIVEDAPQVIRAVKQAGFKTLGVAGSFATDQLSDADFVLSDLTSIEVRRVLPILNTRLSQDSPE